MKRSQPRSRSAVFFDLDKTILATSTSVALRTPLREAGLLTRRGALLGLLIQLPYLIKGADEQATEKMRESLGEIAAGWDGVYLESTVKDALSRSIDPVCFVEALEEIALHRAAGALSSPQPRLKKWCARLLTCWVLTRRSVPTRSAMRTERSPA